MGRSVMIPLLHTAPEAGHATQVIETPAPPIVKVPKGHGAQEASLGYWPDAQPETVRENSKVGGTMIVPMVHLRLRE